MKKLMKKYAGGKRVISSEDFPNIPMEDDVITSPLEEAPLPPIKSKKKKKKKPVKKNMGGMMNYSKGGGVRGYGMAKGGRACKMVSMKGS